MSGARPRYPWRLGAPSFVMPGDIAANVTRLAPLVDAVQLLFFESVGETGLPHPVDILFLREQAVTHDLAYTVHLPTDLRLGSVDGAVRQQGIDEVERLMEELDSLDPMSFDLHLFREPDLAEDQWQANLELGLAGLATALGDRRGLVAVENIDYPFELVSGLVDAAGFGRCVDLGHLSRYGHQRDDAAGSLAGVRHLHYHGVVGGKDHQALADRNQAVVQGQALAEAGYDGVVTLEMYSLQRLTASLAVLAEAWRPFRVM